MSSQPLIVTPVRSKADRKTFLDLPYRLYKGEAAWHPPLRFERADHLNPAKNPSAASVQRELFIARRGGKPVGRIAALINAVHIERHNDGAGHFGFFDCEANVETGLALLKTAEDWLRVKGYIKIIGPTSHSVNEESGLLVDGFEYPPILMMPYGRADYQEMVDQAGYKKAIDLLAFKAELAAGYPRPKMTQSMVAMSHKDPAISFRILDKSRFEDEVRLAMRIFNDAWSENWGFIPFTDEQIGHLAAELKPILFTEGFRIGMINGEPVAFIAMLPNVNEAARDLNGKLLPFGWAKLVTRLKVSGVKTSRIPLMGLRKEYQNSRQGLAIVARLCEDVFAAGRVAGFTHCELSWILETNKSMIRICEQASAVPYKTYRMYEKAL